MPPGGRLSFGRTRPAVVPSPPPLPVRHPPLSPMKFLQVWWSSLLRQLRGQPTSTVLCCSPPRPLDWMRCDIPSRTLQEVTTWQKPLTFSASISRRIDWSGGAERGKSHLAPPTLALGAALLPRSPGHFCPMGQGLAEGKVSHGWFCWAHLLGTLDLQVVVQEGAVQHGAHNGQPLAGLQLVGEGEQLWVSHVLVLVHPDEHQQLRSGKTEDGGLGASQVRWAPPLRLECRLPGPAPSTRGTFTTVFHPLPVGTIVPHLR